MELNRLSKLNEKKKKLKPIPVYVEDEEVCHKLLSDQSYNKKDMEKSVVKIFEKFDLDAKNHFIITDNFDKNNANDLFHSNNPIFCIYDKFNENWALFCIIKNEENDIFVLHIDSQGFLIPAKIEQKILKRNNQVQFVNYSTKENHDSYLYGAFCLRNLNFMLNYYTQDQNNFIKNFTNLKFCVLDDLNDVKLQLVTDMTLKLGEHKIFLETLKTFINDLEIAKNYIEFQKIVEEELSKGEENYNTERVEEARKNLFNENNNKDIYEKYNEAVDINGKKCQLKIEAEFPKEIKHFVSIFTTLEHITVNEKFYNVLENISNILTLDFDKMKMFYELTQKQDEKNEEVDMKNIDNIIENLPETTETSSSTDCTPITDLLKEVVLGMDGDQTPHDNDIMLLQKNYDFVKEKMELWSTATAKEIYDWANQKKGKLTQSTEDICEAVAVIDRGFHLLSGKFHLRDTQILAALIFFHKADRGILVQIKTGEGKTTIVAILAIIKALQGQTVDVITSNPILAQEGVDETQSLYNLFNLTVSTNSNNKGGNKIGYKADVLYGTISSFQFDYLKDNFEGYTVRYDRRFGQVILDEVDSMLVDNGGHIAKLASPFPGMETFRYIYIKIWQELQNAEEEFKTEMTNKIQEKIVELQETEHFKKPSVILSDYIEELSKDERKYLKNKIKSTNILDIPFIPLHLRSYAENKLDIWIKNAIHAKYNCHEHQQYRIIKDSTTGEGMIVPVDYMNTGVTLKNTIWSNGLHQFIQLKHNLFLTYESLTSSFISNIGYIKNYSPKNIFGLTGTLGSTAEQTLLADIYGVDYAKLPTYKPKIFEELPGLVFDDPNWDQELALNVLDNISQERATLVICETGADLSQLKANLEVLKEIENIDQMKIRVFANEDDAEETKEKVDIGHVILSTNIAGRGTNFKTTEELEAKGGLHVCVGFLPCNQRVEGQAFGRTSRQGNRGTAQLVIRQSEVEELDLSSNERDFDKIKLLRDKLEKDRLKKISETLVKELDFKDIIFKSFAKKYKNFKRKTYNKNHYYVVQDLKEFWAFWLENKNYTIKNISSLNPKEELQLFMDEAKEIFDGNICHNPYYCISKAESYLEEDDYKRAKQSINRAIELSHDNGLLIGAYIKLFEIAMHGNGIVMERFKKALANIMWINYEKHEDYKGVTISNLEKASNAIALELDYIDKNCNVENDNFNKILIITNGDNMFLKHIYGRYILLRNYKQNFDELIEKIRTEDGLAMDGQLPCDLENLSKIFRDGDIQKVSINEVEELESISLHSIYSLKVVEDVDKTVIDASRYQITSGMGMLAIGLIFPFLFPFLSPVAGLLISEGILDIVMNLFSKDQSFNKSSFIKDKITSYAVLCLSFGVSALAQSTRILNQCLKYCKKLATVLRNSPILKNFCLKLAQQIEKIQATFQKMLDAAKLAKLEKVSRLQLVKTFAIKTGKDIGKSLLQSFVFEPLVNRSTNQLFLLFKSKFKENVCKSIWENSELCKKITVSSSSEIDKIIENCFSKDDPLIKNISLSILSKFNNTFFDVVINIVNFSSELAKIIIIATKFTKYFDQNLLSDGEGNNNLEFYIPQIAEQVSTKFIEHLKKLLKETYSIGEVLFHKYDPSYSVNSILTFERNVENDEFDECVDIILNPYNILGLVEEASDADVRIAYRKLAIKYHPDKNPSDPEANEKFTIVKNAYDDICNQRQTTT